MWELLKRETELMKKPYEMRQEKKVENKMKAMEICKSIVPPSVCQRALVPKDILKFQLRKPQTLRTSIFMNYGTENLL